MFSSAIQDEIATTAETEVDLQHGWPSEIQLRLWRQSPWYELPYAFLPAFPALSAADIRPLVVFGRLFASSIFLHDPLADRHVVAREAATTTSRIMAMQFEAYRVLHARFAPDAAFWALLRGYLSDYAGACMQELRLCTGVQPWRTYDEPTALGVAIAKSGPSRAIIAGLVELAGAPQLLAPLVTALNHCNVACQMWDDLNDWKEDLQHGCPSLLLARILPEGPGAQPDVARVGREIYYGGHASHVLSLALAALDDAAALARVVPDLPWYRQIAGQRAKYQSALQDVRRIIQTNRRRVETQPKLTFQAPEARGPWQQQAWAGAAFLVRQWQLGFGEARDIVAYPDGGGVTYQYGDVFQRALIVDALSDVNAASAGGLQRLLDYEVDYLLDCRRPGATGGWAYFRDLDSLPPDADDLAQVIQAFLQAGHRAHVVAHCEAPLAVLLRDARLGDGSFKTWLVPAGERSVAETRQAGFIAPSDTAHEEVVANVLFALSRYDAARFAEVIERGQHYLMERQHADGQWTSTWYDGPYYAIYVCVRALGTARPAATRRALALLRRWQREDGGWGPEASDALNTALALLALACAGEPEDVARASRALAYLASTRGSDGSWPRRGLVFVGQGAFTGSRTLTTALVVKAALAWQRGARAR